MRTFLALLSNSPKQLWEICRLAPKGYLMHLIVTEDMLCKIAALITPGFVTYYMNSGAESMMKAVYYARYRRLGTLPLDIYYHLKAAEEPLYCFTGAKAIVMTCEGAVHVRIGRKVYDATIFELPSGWYPAFLTEFSNQYQVPSNIPVSPTGEYFFTYLTWKMKLAHPISNIEVRLYEAWWAEQNPPEQAKIIEEMKEHGKQPPIRCMRFMEATLREKAYIIRYCLRKIPMQVIDDFIENDIFCREWAEQLGIIPDELREPRFGDQLMPRSGFDCDGWEAEAAKLPESVSHDFSYIIFFLVIFINQSYHSVPNHPVAIRKESCLCTPSSRTTPLPYDRDYSSHGLCFRTKGCSAAACAAYAAYNG